MKIIQVELCEMALFKNNGNISVQVMMDYVNNLSCNTIEDEQLVYKYLYFLSKSYAQKRRLFSTTLEYEYFAIQCASELYERILNDSFKGFLSDISTISFSYKIITKNTLNEEDNKYSFANHLIDLLDSTNFKSFDLTEIDKFIIQFLQKLPKQKYTAEFENITTSVLLSVLNNLKIRKSKFFLDYSLSSIKVVLYHLSNLYSNYVKCLTQLILVYTKDSYNNILDSNKLTPQLLHLNEVLYEKR